MIPCRNSQRKSQPLPFREAVHALLVSRGLLHYKAESDATTAKLQHVDPSIHTTHSN
uniref:Uncharacterized protein n=1 Tax=Arundo donax TaxID=35708 RepID=A0A0A9ASW7_ARUDO